MAGIKPSVYEYIVSVTDQSRCLLDEPMKKHSTFRVGGEADLLVKIASSSELSTVIKYLNQIQLPYFIKGNGSNILVSDKGYRGVILEISDMMNDISVDGTTITAKAGALMSSIAHVALEHGLGGMEFAAGIPGTIGGGVTMNAGAYDGELKDIVTSVKVLTSEGDEVTLSREMMNFGYRTSVIKNRPFVVTEVSISLSNKDRSEIKDRMDELGALRRSKQPLEFPSGGSTFKRPEGYYAGKLIMDTGLRGYSIGGAQVSEKHCGFVINKGNAKAADIYELIEEVSEKVYAKFGVKLETEIIILGDF